MTLDKEKLENFKRDLQAKRHALAQDLIQATSDFINDEATFADAVDQASAETDKNLVLRIKNREREVMLQIDQALRRIDMGSFGLCVSCGDPIAEARMLANPATTLCIECKAELESEQNHFPRRA